MLLRSGYIMITRPLAAVTHHTLQPACAPTERQVLQSGYTSVTKRLHICYKAAYTAVTRRLIQRLHIGLYSGYTSAYTAVTPRLIQRLHCGLYSGYTAVTQRLHNGYTAVTQRLHRIMRYLAARVCNSHGAPGRSDVERDALLNIEERGQYPLAQCPVRIELGLRNLRTC